MSTRLPALDILRGIAILLVLGRHAPRLPPGAFPPVKTLFDTWQRGGWVGVDLFFVLSGFLVSGLIFREIRQRGSFSLGRFLLRRALRIYPPFYLLLLLTLLLFPGLPIQSYLREAFYIQNYAGGIWNQTWSLAVEEHFYFLLPWLLVVLLVVSRKSSQPLHMLPFVLAAVFVLSLALRIRIAGAPYNHLTHLFPTHLRLDSLAAGVLVAYLYHFKPHSIVAMRPYRLPLASTGVLCFMPAFLFTLERTPFIYTYGLTLFYLGSAFLLIAALLWRPARFGLWARAVAWVGFYSYSIYLFHMVSAAWIFPAFQAITDPLPVYLLLAVYFAAALLLGFAMGKIVERPALRLRELLAPATPTPTSPSPR